MRYDNMTHNKEWFLVTPNELEEILAGFHLVIENTRVEKEHQESDLAEYIRKYSGLYAFRSTMHRILYENS